MKLSINVSSNYDIIIKSGILGQINKYLDEFNSGQLFVICHSPCLLAKAESMYSLLKNNSYNVQLLEILDGEQNKQFDNVQFII